MSTTTITATTLSALPIATSISQSLDDALTSFLSTWSITSTLILLTILTILIYPLFFTPDPDTHPFLLARQSQPSPLRHEGESAVYRAIDIPHGYPLRASLGVRDEGMAKWSPGRAGDLRDIWRVAVNGPVGEGGKADGSKVGKLLEVRGREGVEERELRVVTGEINAIGEWVKQRGGGQKRVAVCLCNGVELLACIFAAAFYDFSITLIPYGLAPTETSSLLSQANADILVAEAGTLPLDSALSSSKSIKDIILVAKGQGKHMNWDESAPQGVSISTWDKITSNGSKDVLPLDKETKPRPISIFSSTGGGYELVEFTSENIISGIAALTHTIARTNKLSPADILLPTTPLTDIYTLCWVLAALYSNASIALNSVAGSNIDLALCTAGANPTVLIAAPASVKKSISDTTQSGRGPGILARYLAGSSLKTGVMPKKRPSARQTSLSGLRLLLIPQPSTRSTRLFSSTLHEARLVFNAKVAYALTTPNVAGAVCQTNVHDYRDKGDVVCVGAPLGSVEISMTAGSEEDLGSSTPKGKLVVKGPAVSGGKVDVDIAVQIAGDCTASLL